jgi:hypothetical protein
MQTPQTLNKLTKEILYFNQIKSWGTLNNKNDFEIVAIIEQTWGTESSKGTKNNKKKAKIDLKH